MTESLAISVHCLSRLCFPFFLAALLHLIQNPEFQPHWRNWSSRIYHGFHVPHPFIFATSSSWTSWPLLVSLKTICPLLKSLNLFSPLKEILIFNPQENIHILYILFSTSCFIRVLINFFSVSINFLLAYIKCFTCLHSASPYYTLNLVARVPVELIFASVAPNIEPRYIGDIQ